MKILALRNRYAPIRRKLPIKVRRWLPDVIRRVTGLSGDLLLNGRRYKVFDTAITKRRRGDVLSADVECHTLDVQAEWQMLFLEEQKAALPVHFFSHQDKEGYYIEAKGQALVTEYNVSHHATGEVLRRCLLSFNGPFSIERDHHTTTEATDDGTT